MHVKARQLIASSLIALAIVSSPALAQTAAPSGTDMFLDLVITRPLGLVAVIAGSAAFVVSLPFTIPSSSVDRAAEELVKKPVRYTFKRPLGAISD